MKRAAALLGATWVGTTVVAAAIDGRPWCLVAVVVVSVFVVLRS